VSAAGIDVNEIDGFQRHQHPNQKRNQVVVCAPSVNKG
jgi:hypothetical protein